MRGDYEQRFLTANAATPGGHSSRGRYLLDCFGFSFCGGISSALA
jgi:hypothetical protein